MTSVLALTTAIDAAAAAEELDLDLIYQLQKMLPKSVKLVRCNAFKAKAAMVTLLGSVAGAGGAGTEGLVGVLVPCLMEFLGSEDWAARKAAAEALAEALGGLGAPPLSPFFSSPLSRLSKKKFRSLTCQRRAAPMTTVVRSVTTSEELIESVDFKSVNNGPVISVAAQQGTYLAQCFNRMKQCEENPEGLVRFRESGRHRFCPLRFYIMHLEDRELKFSKITHHASVTQCLGSIGGSEWFLGVAKPSIVDGSEINNDNGKNVTKSRCGHDYIPPHPDDVRIFRIEGAKFLKLNTGTWHAGPLFRTKPWIYTT